MAAKQQLLEQLVDIAEPAYQLPWQIPLGGYILLTVALVAIAYTCWTLYQRWRYLAAKRQALVLLNQLPPQAASQINQLLKRVVQHYAPAHSMLSASTSQWQHFLQQQLPAQPLPALTALLYQAEAADQQSQQFYQFARNWLQQLRPAKLASSHSQTLAVEAADA